LCVHTVKYAEPKDSAKRDKTKAFDRRHKRTMAKLADKAVEKGQAVYDKLTDDIMRSIKSLSFADIAVGWTLDPRATEPLFDSIRLSMTGSRVIGSSQFWDDLNSLGYAKWLKRNELDAELPTTWGDASLAAMFAAAFDEVPPLKDDLLLKWFTAKTPHTRETFDALAQIDKTNAFTIAGTETISLVNRVKEVAREALTSKEGMSKREFIAKVNDEFDKMGVTRANRYHLDTVYRTNMHSAYNANRYIEAYELSTPELDEFFPYLQYSTTGAMNVCPICEPYNDLVYRKDDPVVQNIFPPNHYNCACAMVPVSVTEFEDEGLKAAEGSFLDDPDVPNPIPGFDGPPAMVGAVDVSPRKGGPLTRKKKSED